MNSQFNQSALGSRNEHAHKHQQKNNSLDINNKQYKKQSTSFLGNPARLLESSAWLQTAHEPISLATIGLQIPGAKSQNDIYIEKNALKKIAMPLVNSLGSVFEQMTIEFGTVAAVLRLSPAESEILVLAQHVQTLVQRENFVKTFFKKMEDVNAEAKLVEKLAKMTSMDFSDSWFVAGARPDPSMLVLLDASYKLERLLDRAGVELTVNGQVVELPSATAIKLQKEGAVPIECIGNLSGMSSKPQMLNVIYGNGGNALTLRATGKNYVEALSAECAIGDRIKVSYYPLVDLLKPFNEHTQRGRLKDAHKL
jgi:hypothetical protein